VSERARIIAAAAILAVVCALLYAPKLDNTYVYDDYAFILNADENADIANIPGFFFTDTHRLYRPLRQTLYTLVRHGFGLSETAHHVVGIALHACVTVLLFLIVLLLFERPRLAFLTAAISALHPVHVARVANTTGSFDLLGLALSFGALAAAICYLKTGKARSLAATAILFALGLLGSEEAATAPLLFVLFALALPELRASARRIGSAAAVLFGVLAAYIAIRYIVVPGFSRVESHVAGGLYETIWTMAVVFWKYIGLAILPVNLAAEHAVTIHPGPDAISIAALLGLIGLAGFAFYRREKIPVYFVAIGWFFIGLAPFSNLIPLQTLYAEHYFYSGLLGFCLALAYGIEKARSRSKIAALIATVAILGTYSVLTVQRIDIWQNNETLWSDSLAKEPDTYMGNLNWGTHIKGSEPRSAACPYFEKAARLKPSGHEAYAGLGNCAMWAGDPKLARKNFVQSLKNQEGYISALHGLMQADLALGEYEEAYGLAVTLLKTKPGDVVSLNVVGYILARTGRCEEAISILKRLIQLSPPEDIATAAEANLSHCQQKQGKAQEK
jgi:protein O-mannosyl-transferase